MGIIPTPDVPGGGCSACWPAAETPTTLKAFFAGIMKGEFWNEGMGEAPNGYHDISQSPFNNCAWFTSGLPLRHCLYHAAPTPSSLYFQLTQGIKYFVSADCPACTSYFTNTRTTWEDNDFYGGFAFVSTPEGMSSMIKKITPLLDPDPRMELFPKSDGEIVVRYAGKRDGTNISIKLDTSLL